MKKSIMLTSFIFLLVALAGCNHPEEITEDLATAGAPADLG